MPGRQNGQPDMAFPDSSPSIAAHPLPQKLNPFLPFAFFYERHAALQTASFRSCCQPVKMLLAGYLYGIKQERTKFS